jgi:hypothetical protein
MSSGKRGSQDNSGESGDGGDVTFSLDDDPPFDPDRDMVRSL